MIKGLNIVCKKVKRCESLSKIWKMTRMTKYIKAESGEIFSTWKL